MATKKVPGAVVGAPSKIIDVDFEMVKFYAKKGFTDPEIAKCLKVSPATIYNWRNEYPEFLEALKQGKEIADSRVEASLYERALGYEHPDEHISNYQGVITKTPIIKKYAPDPTSMIFWLKNRKPAEWREKADLPEVPAPIMIMAESGAQIAILGFEQGIGTKQS